MKMIYNSCLSLLIYVRETTIWVNQQHVSTKSAESTKVVQFTSFQNHCNNTSWLAFLLQYVIMVVHFTALKKPLDSLQGPYC